MKLSIKLKYLILSVALLSLFITFVSSLSSIKRMNEKNLIEATLETNRVYAQKLSNSVDIFFLMTLQTLQFSANVLAPYISEDHDSRTLFDEANRLKLQSNKLNSIIIANAKGEILATSPNTLQLVGRILDSEGGIQALKERKPIISKPYMGLTDRLIIFISQPIFNEQGEYLGLVGGTIYLLEDNFLTKLLGEHYYNDGSYVYVVDEDGTIIYHLDESRVNSDVRSNPVVQRTMNGESGSQRVINTKNVDMLAGYAYVPSTGWGIVSQTPTAVTLEPNAIMIREMFIRILPSLLLSILLAFVISRIIALPLQRLAVFTELSTTDNQKEKLNNVKAWYYEAIQLKKALTYSLNFLHDKVDHITVQSETDPLTGLMNRRTLDRHLAQWLREHQNFSLVIVDIDHFKFVNDTYGHQAGDEVLIYLAQLMRDEVGEQGICCRYGGEEFVVLLPNVSKQEALALAEKIRLNISSKASPCGEIITISAGIASYDEDADHVIDVFNIADKRLYLAKHNGRNRSEAMDPIVIT